jgi:uncharacterized OB-fold protein
MSTTPKPAPIPDARSQPFFDAAARDELALQRCDICGTWMWPVRPRCISCFADAPPFALASGRATLYSYSFVHRTYDPAFADEVPYNVVLVDLEEGVRVLSNVVGVKHEDLQIGMPLRVVFERVGDVSIPKFRPDREHA